MPGLKRRVGVDLQGRGNGGGGGEYCLMSKTRRTSASCVVLDGLPRIPQQKQYIRRTFDLRRENSSCLSVAGRLSRPVLSRNLQSADFCGDGVSKRRQVVQFTRVEYPKWIDGPACEHKSLVACVGLMIVSPYSLTEAANHLSFR